MSKEIQELISADGKARGLISAAHDHALSLPEGLEKDLVCFAGKCLESSLFEYDGDFAEIVITLLSEFLSRRRLDAEDEERD